jgi:ubiquinone/menaquinone biosynthesis C-methylase UbiE
VKRIPVSVDEGYRRWAEGYDAYPNGLIYLEEPRVRALVGEVAGLCVLDAASGTGRHASWLAAQGARVTAIDPNPAMLAIARQKCPDVTFLEAELAHTGLPDAAFDAVVCALVMEHLPDPRPALAELVRVLAPSGVLVLSVFHPWFLMRGVPPHFELADEDIEIEMPAHVHLPSTYVTDLLARGMQLTAFEEPVVDDALIARLAKMEKHRGQPLALIFRFEKRPAESADVRSPPPTRRRVTPAA